MNWFRILLIILLLVINCHNILYSQKSWTLDQCITYALEKNFSIHNQELGVNIIKTDYKQAINELYPSLNFQTSYDQYFGRSINPTTNSYIDIKFYNNSYGLSTSVDLFKGFIKLNTISFQRLNLEAEKNKLQQVKNEVSFTVINSYFNVLLQQGLLKIAHENFNLSRNQLDYTAKFVELGRKPGAEILESEANLATDSFLLVQSYNLLEQATMELKYQMNFPENDSLIIDTLVQSVFTGSIDTLSIDKLYEFAATVLPDLSFARNNLLATKKAHQVSKGSFSPRLVFYAGWNSQFMETNRDSLERIIPFSNQMSNNSNEYMSLQLEIPLFSKFSKNTSLSKSNLKYQQAKVQYDDVSYKLKMRVEKSLAEWHAAKVEYKSSLSQLNKNSKAFEAAKKKLDNGLINIIEFSIQKSNLFRAKTEVLRTGLQVMLKERYVRFLMTGSLLSGT